MDMALYQSMLAYFDNHNIDPTAIEAGPKDTASATSDHHMSDVEESSATEAALASPSHTSLQIGNLNRWKLNLLGLLKSWETAYKSTEKRSTIYDRPLAWCTAWGSKRGSTRGSTWGATVQHVFTITTTTPTHVNSIKTILRISSIIGNSTCFYEHPRF